MCPVKTYEMYINKLEPKNPYLWQQAKEKVTWDDDTWFTKEPQSKNKIGGLLTKLSTDAKLSKNYTNHCVRATCVTLLDRSGFEARHIMTVSGHKKVESIQSYANVTSNAKKREMSESLASAMIMSPKRNKTTETDKIPNNDIQNMSFRELLELSPEQEAVVMKEILDDDWGNMVEVNAVPQAPPVSVNSATNNVTTLNPIAMETQNVIPRMVFNNSNITINFNVNHK